MDYVDQIPLYNYEQEDLLEENNIIHYDWEAIADEFAQQIKDVLDIKVDVVAGDRDWETERS